MGLSIFDKRYKKNRTGPKSKKDQNVNISNDEPIEQYKLDYMQQAKQRVYPLVWRDYLNLSFDMDIVDLIESLSSLFNKMDSFDIDPDNRKGLLEEPEQFLLHKNVDRALRWLTDKVSESRLEPIVVTLRSPGDSKIEIEASLNDPRSLVSLDNVKESAKNLNHSSIVTPHFLKHFDFDNALDRHYLSETDE